MRDYLQVFQLILRSIAYDFPRPEGNQAAVGDASTRHGNCLNHPGGSHGDHGLAVDMNYYCFAENNYTQYTPPGWDKYDTTKIWDGDNLLTDVFDWERNYWLIIRLIGAFPLCQIMLDERIANRIFSMVLRNIGEKEARYFLNRVFKDSPGHYNHDIHVHITLATEPHMSDGINYEFPLLM